MSNTLPSLLLVDDEERILRSLKIVLRRHYHVITTTNPHKAITIANEQNIDVIISDQRMPEMFGSELLSKIKEVSPNTVRILLTGYSDLNAAIEAVNGGEIYQYLTKPWNTDQIKETVANAVQIAQTMSAPTPIPTAEEIVTNTKAKPGILLIDNDVSTHTVVASACNGLADVHTASSLEAALHCLSEREDIAIVISELHLNNQNIGSLLTTLRQYNPFLVSIVLTSFKDTTALVKLINHAQIHRYLPKPARAGLLQKSIQSALNKHKQLKRNPHLSKTIAAPRKTAEVSPVSTKLLGYLQKLRSKRLVSNAI